MALMRAIVRGGSKLLKLNEARHPFGSKMLCTLTQPADEFRLGCLPGAHTFGEVERDALHITDPRDPGSFGYSSETLKILKQLGRYYELTPKRTYYSSDNDPYEEEPDLSIWTGYAQLQSKEVYMIHVHLRNQDAESVFKDVMEKADCASGFIRPCEDLESAFYAALTKRQAEKLEGVEGVELVNALSSFAVLAG